MEQMNANCAKCGDDLSGKSEIQNHTCSEEGIEVKMEDFIDEEIEYLETDSENENEIAKSTLEDDSTEWWTLEDTEHLLQVYHDALPVIYGENGNGIDVWQTLLANLDVNIALKYNSNNVRDRIHYIFSPQAKKLPVNKPLLPLLKKIELLEGELTYETLTLETEQNQNGDSLVMDNDNTSQDEEETANENENENLYKCKEEEEEAEDDPGEKQEFSKNNEEGEIDDDVDELNETIRWTGKEILRIISIYRKYINELATSLANKDKRKVWGKISSEMIMVGDRKCNPYLARMKIMNLKKTWTKQKNANGESKWRYFREMNEMMKEEEKAKAVLLGNGKSISSSEADEEEEIVTAKKRKRKNDEPGWFLQYRNDSEKRHEEKLKLKSKLLDILEQFASKLKK